MATILPLRETPEISLSTGLEAQIGQLRSSRVRFPGTNSWHPRRLCPPAAVDRALQRFGQKVPGLILHGRVEGVLPRHEGPAITRRARVQAEQVIMSRLHAA
jgi:hypothetical protein